MPKRTEFEEWIYNEIESQKGLYVPVTASIFERLLITKLPCDKIHPNPEDEFCFPEIGPSFRIISNYVNEFRENVQNGYPAIKEPLMVGKVHPSGYMLINGHHRWAAAMKSGFKTVPVKIINMTTPADIRRMIENSKHDKRVTMDLDEVVLRDANDPYIEKVPGLRGGGKNNKRMRLGIPALFRHFNTHGYDIWVYSANYYSIDDVQRYFRHYSVNVDGIIVGTAKKKVSESEAEKNMAKLIANKYGQTVHIDNDMVLVTHGGSGDFDEIAIEATGSDWSKEIIEKSKSFVKTEE